MQSNGYTAVVFDENGADQGPLDVSGAKDDNQARDLAMREGLKWLAQHGLNKATVQISRDGFWLPIVEVLA